MPYIALKPVKFDKQYNIGVIIPNEVVKSEIAGRLIRCGVIQEYTENEPKSINLQNVYEVINNMKADELMLLYEDTKLKEIIEAAAEQEEIDKTNGMFLSDSAVQLDKIKALAESTQGNETESANEDIQPIEVKQDNDNTENNNDKEVKKTKTSKSKKV